MTQGQIFKQSLTGLNSEFSFSWTSCLTQAEEFSLSYYLLIAGGRIIGFMPFPRVLVLCEMQLFLFDWLFAKKKKRKKEKILNWQQETLEKHYDTKTITQKNRKYERTMNAILHDMKYS